MDKIKHGFADYYIRRNETPYGINNVFAITLQISKDLQSIVFL